MYAAESRGEVPKGTANRWEKETPKGKKLPKKKKKKKNKKYAELAYDVGVQLALYDES
jgi:hypothetical protein